MASWAKLIGKSLAVAVATTDVIATIDTDVADGYMVLCVYNSGDAALDAFTLEAQCVEGGPWATLDAATPALPVVYRTTAPATLASLATTLIQVDVQGIRSLRISASADAAVTTLDIYTNQSGSDS